MFFSTNIFKYFCGQGCSGGDIVVLIFLFNVRVRKGKKKGRKAGRQEASCPNEKVGNLEGKSRSLWYPWSGGLLWGEVAWTQEQLQGGKGRRGSVCKSVPAEHDASNSWMENRFSKEARRSPRGNRLKGGGKPP